MEKLELVINKNIEVIWDREVYKSVIQEVNENYFSISIPSKEGTYIPLRQGDIAEIVYNSMPNIFQFDSHVLGRKIDGIPLVMLEIPNKYKTIQRRQFFRAATLDVTTISYYEKLKDKNDKRIKTLKPLNDNFNKAVLLDLSGGGMRIKVDEPAELGDILHLFLETQKDTIEIYGKIVRVTKNELNAYLCGINFLDLTEKERDKIIQYTFELMRGRRTKGL